GLGRFTPSLASHALASTSASSETPVATPLRSNRSTTSSVATLPDAPGAYGQPPTPPREPAGTPTPIVSPSEISSTPSARSRSTSVVTADTATAPSYGQPHTVET